MFAAKLGSAQPSRYLYLAVKGDSQHHLKLEGRLW